MCGIAGYFGNNSHGLQYLKDSVSCLSHRGPDGQGVIDFEWSGLSHTRLALITPGPDGAQPIEGRKYGMVFNGEIYNWKEIASKIQTLIPNGNLSSDSRVLLSAIELWGLEPTLKQLRGIFSFALIDLLNKSLILVRDEAGTKPLYYIQHDSSLYFASEIKAFRKFNLQIDDSQLNEYLTFQNTFSEKCIFKDVYLVPQGSYLEFNAPDSPPKRTIWENSYFRSNNEIVLDDALIALGDLIGRAVDRNLVADFPVGFFLSGGLDSSTIGDYISKKAPRSKSYTVGFESPTNANYLNTNDERLIAKEIALVLGIENHDYVVTHKDMEKSFDELCWAIEEPRVGQSYPNFFASKLARRFEKAVMSGAGGDELFGGYPWRYSKAMQLQKSGKSAQIDAYFDTWHRLGSTKDISALSGITQQEHVKIGKSKLSCILESNSTKSSHFDLEDFLYFEFKTFLHGLLLVDDKISMSQGLEVRLPLLDQDLASFARSLPNNLRISNKNLQQSVDMGALKSVEGQDVGKLILRELAKKNSNPAELLPKKGFTGPDEFWFRNESSGFVRDRLLQKNSKIWTKLDYEVGSKLVLNHLNGTSNNRLLVWSLLSLESVFRQFQV